MPHQAAGAARIAFIHSLRGRLILLFLAIALIPLIGASALESYQSERALLQDAVNKLIAVRNIKAAQISQYFESRLIGVKNLSNHPITLESLRAFQSAVQEIPDMQPQRAQYLGRPNLEDAGDGSAYSQAHARYHAIFRQYQQDYGYYDIFLIEPQTGQIVYSVFKEDDFGTSLTTGPYANTNLAEVFKRTRISEDRDFVTLQDFAFYAPSNNAAAGFIASPIFAEQQLRGVLVFQLSTQQIDEIMQERSGMGETGETILISSDDFLLRSDSRFFTHSTLLRQQVDTEATRASAQGKTGVKTIIDYRGEAALIAHMPLQLPDVRWSLNAKMDKAEIFATVHSLRLLDIGIVAFCSVIVVILAWFFSKSIARPIQEITVVTQNLAAGQLNQHIQIKGNNEISLMLEAFHTMIGHLQQIIDNTVTALEQLSEGQAKIDLNREFPGEFAQIKQSLESTAHQLAKATAANERQDWLKNGQAQLNAQLTGEQDITTLAKKVIDFLVTYLKLEVGLLYLVKQPETGAAYLEVAATYGYTQQGKVHTFQCGEGLVGQAMLERKLISRTHAPEEYAYVMQSGLTQAVPKHVVLLPFLYEDAVKGVIELGGTAPFPALHSEFLAQAMPSIGIAVNASESRTRTQALLQQSQAQAEKLQAQKVAMQEANEELQSQTEELQTQQEELQSQQEELRQTNEALEERSSILQQQQAMVADKNRDLEKAKEALQNKAEELELASKYKSEFLANMSHELRTPLNSLLILAELLAENKEQHLSDKEVECARTIHSSGNDLLNLINEILDLSKIEAGKVEIQASQVALAELVQFVQRNFKHVAEEKSLSFQLDAATDLPEFIYTDGQRLQQIMNNLLSNAFKFTSKGGVSLAIRRPHAQETLSNSQLNREQCIVFSVTDTGIGIPKEKQKVVFEAFQQADGTTSRRFGGTGLGLSISRQLCQLMGGEIQIRSEEGQGSCFTVYLPEQLGQIVAEEAMVSTSIIAAASTVPPSAPIVREKPSEPQAAIVDDRDTLTKADRSLLIIEDDRNFSKVLMELAHEKGFKSLLAENGTTGLALAEQYLPSAIILDIGLPELDGWSVMEALKNDLQTRHIPVHFVSAENQPQYARSLGAIGYSLKPVDVQGLSEIFQNIQHFVEKPIKDLLLLTDDTQCRENILPIIDNEQANCIIANSLEVAAQAMHQQEYECLVLDINFAEAHGLEALKQLLLSGQAPALPIIVYAERELTSQEEQLLEDYQQHLTIKAVKSTERLLDEVTLFLHGIAAKLPNHQQDILRHIHDKEALLKGKKVLVIDDDMRNVFALTAALENKGMEIVMAVNGKQGLEQLANHPDTSLVLVDIMMPEMDGYETMQNIRSQPQYRKLPIIALTAKAMKSDRSKCIEAGANDYLAKPVEMHKLLSLMRVWLYQ